VKSGAVKTLGKVYQRLQRAARLGIFVTVAGHCRHNRIDD
jgi:hypothetical protein